MKKNTKVLTTPHSKESEMMVLGCMLTNVNSLNVASDALDATHFYFKEHQIVFSALKEAFRRDKPADIHLIAEELKRQNTLDEVGGVSYLTHLAQYAGTSAFIEEYVNIVRDKSILRQMVEAAQNIEKNAMQEPDNVHDFLDEAQANLFHISQAVNATQGVLLKELLTGLKATSKIPYLKELEEKQEIFLTKGKEGLTSGVQTHFSDLDKIISGFNPSNLMILAARPAMGKTAFAVNIAENYCFKNNLPIGIFSLEMTAEQLLHRMVCSQSEVESEKIKTGSLNGEEYQSVVTVVNNMMNHTMLIDDQPGLKITDLRARARRMKEAHDIQLLIIDYLQLLSGSGTFRSSESRQNEISEISRLLKNLARELNIPILCLSQLSRKVEERQGHRPIMSDLRESGCLAGNTQIQDADSGKIYSIEELAKRKKQTPIKVWSLDKDLKIRKHTMSKAFYSGKKVLYRLTTRNGRYVDASANHPFYKLEGWTRLDQLIVGDKIALPLNVATSKESQDSFHSSIEASVEHKVFSENNSYKHEGTTTSTLLKEPEKMQLSESDIFWDNIVSIEKLSQEDVYDATVDGVHNFVANDIIVHNSLEQDSDLIFFLLRREYYDPYDKPGQAELIVAKNRHGSIGSVNLTFRKEFAQFVNYSSMDSVEEPDSLALDPS